jgi:2-polyprenyl-3-methyl-5-hydroxy-6-metoxy-1,4-benzoquinol methylase
MGCGTGKNTSWLVQKGAQITAVDFSEEMLAKARTKIQSEGVQFVQADLTQDWHFINGKYEVVTFSLVLEHIEGLAPVLQKAADALVTGGFVYIGELHPVKQYSGSKARFETAEGTQAVPCYTHHVSDFIHAGKKAGLQLAELREYFDGEDRTTAPRILALLLRKV